MAKRSHSLARPAHRFAPWAAGLAGAVALTAALTCSPRPGNLDRTAVGQADRSARTVTRLLRGPVADGAPWEITSGAPLVAAGVAPESGVPPQFESRFDGVGSGTGSDEGAGALDGWFTHRSFAQLLGGNSGGNRPSDGSASDALPTVRDGRLVLPPHAVAARIVAAPPLTPFVLTVKLREPDATRGERRLFLFDLDADLSALRDPLAIADRILHGNVVAGQRVVGRALDQHDRSDSQRYLKPTVVARAADGSETWRVEFSSEWRTHSLALVAVGSSEIDGINGTTPIEPVTIDEIALQLLPARALLKEGPGASQNFDLPRPFENFDATTQTTKLRCDWESRRALLLPRGATARCQLPDNLDRDHGGTIEFGLAIVREERLCDSAPHSELVRVRVGSVTQSMTLTLRADAPSNWAEVTLPLAADLEITVAGQDDAMGPLIAISDPLVYARSPVAEPDPTSSLNLLLISLDTLRVDRLGRKVNGQSLTPNLDRLAAESVVATQMLASSSYTLPSHVSLFTSQRPSEHGVLSYDDDYSSERSTTLTEIAARHGWTTAAFTSGGMLNAEFCGIDRGFDRFGEIDALLTPGDHLRDIAPLRDRPDYNRAIAADNRLDRTLLPWLELHRGAPFLALLHTYLIHNYQPEPALLAALTKGLLPTPLRITGPIRYRAKLDEKELKGAVDASDGFRFEGPGEHRFIPERDLPWIEALYDATVAQADRDVGRVLAALDSLGLRERTIVVVTADHGEEFLEHDDLSHARTLFDEILRVPFLMRVPGVAPRRIDAPVESIDVAPTLLARLGLEADPRMRGADLLAPDFEPRALTFHEGIEAGNATRPDGGRVTLRCARTRSAKFVALLPVKRSAHGELAELSRAQLEALGYVGGGVPAGGFFDLEHDPAEQHDLLHEAELTPQQQSRLAALLRALDEEGAPR